MSSHNIANKFCNGKALIYSFDDLKSNISSLADDVSVRNSPDNLQEYYEEKADKLNDVNSIINSLEINEYKDIINIIDEIIDDLNQAIENFNC